MTQPAEEREREEALDVRSKLWIIKGGRRVFGPGLARILGEIETQGTLKAAVESAGISYRHAWNVIRNAELPLGKKLTLPQVGGTGGGGSVLSPEGRALLRIFREVSKEVSEFAGQRFSEKVKGLMGEAK